MSGPTTNSFSRRGFILSALAIVPAIGVFLQSCRDEKYKHIKGSIIGGASSRGHLLRNHTFAAPATVIERDIVIVGGGISGLSAARELKRNGITDFTLLELDERVGGNAVSDENKVSAYPWGAHYLPVPDHRDKVLLEFLQEAGCITGYDDKGLPIYNEMHLCFDPEERLHINGFWQEGLVPHFGVPEIEQLQIKRFFELIDKFKKMKGEDGKDAFCIPLKLASSDPQIKLLDRINFDVYLKQEGFTSNYLHWYLDYCCRDDYGTNIHETSAWAGIHYFASRKGLTANTDSSTVLTWPEGNAWLVRQLKEKLKEHIQTDLLVYGVNMQDNGKVVVDCFSFTRNRSERIICNKVLLATPQFINKKLLSDELKKDKEIYESFTYAPWMVANITLPYLREEKGMDVCWDNVFYDSKSLGYVDATHQHIRLFSDKKVITYYFPLADNDPQEERHKAYQLTHTDWLKHIIRDLEKAHPEIHKTMEHVDIWLWGHGMIRPTKNFISGNNRIKAAQPIQDRIFFAHSDLSGISIFEEAFHQGVDVALQMIY